MESRTRQTKSSISDMMHPGQLHADLGALSQRVLNHEQSLAEFKTTTTASLSGISAQIASLSSGMESRMRPQWGVWAAVLGSVVSMCGIMVTSFIFFVITPIQREGELQRAATHDLSKNTNSEFKDLREKTVTWREHERLLTLIEKHEHRLHDIEVKPWLQPWPQPWLQPGPWPSQRAPQQN